MPEDLMVAGAGAGAGAGGIGSEVLDVIEAINVASPAPSWRVGSVVDDGPAGIEVDWIASRAYEYLGRTQTALQRITSVVGNPSRVLVLANPNESEVRQQ